MHALERSDMNPHVPWFNYLISVALSVSGISLHLILSPHFSLIPFILALPIIFFISIKWGFGPAFVSILIWAYGLSYYHFEPLFTVRISDPGEMMHLLLFLLTSIGISWVVVQSRKREQKQAIVEAENKLKSLRLEQQNQLKDQFTNTLSHDLKNPLSVAMISLGMIAKNPTDIEKVKRLVTKATQSLGRIDDMIQDLLDSRRISAGNPLNMVMDKFEISELLRSIVDECSSVYGDRFQISSSNQLEFLGCRKYLRRAIENLLSNAVKYGDEKSPIELGLDNHPDRIDIWVKNQGRVLSVNERDQILKPFTRLESHETMKEGWGIGLSLVKAIVDGHKGRLEITSSESDGTVFHMWLPKS